MALSSTLLPLSLDRVIEGRYIASPSSILFTIPLEILHSIIGYIASDKSHLASLALVNSTCRQLARSCQFNNLHLDYSSTALQVLAMLQKEAVQRYKSSDRMTVSPSLGACVRQLRIDSQDYWPRLQSMLPPGFRTGQEPDGTAVEIGRCISAHLSESLNQLYWPTAFLVLPTLPNLQSLCIRECFLDDSRLDCLMGLSIKNLELSAEFPQIPKMRTIRNSCRLETLETLSIETTWEFDFAYNNTGLDASGFYGPILASCCSNLRRLVISHRKFESFRSQMPKDRPLSFSMEFPKLKTLYIDSMTLVDARVISCLVREGLTSLSIPYNDTSHFLSEIDQIRTLDMVVLDSFEATELTPTCFIEKNTQIRSLAISWALGAFLGHVIQSLQHHGNLKNLSLVWRENDIPEASLEKLSLLSSIVTRIATSGHLDSPFQLQYNYQATNLQFAYRPRPAVSYRRLEIARKMPHILLEPSPRTLALVTSIEMLHLSAGQLSGYPHDWFVDHDKLRRYVGYLAKLRRLIITRDTYSLLPDEVDIFDPGRYYDFRKPKSASWAAHETRMLRIAFLYVQTLPMLEFLHIGQVLFAVEDDGGIRKPIVTGSAWVGEGEYDVLKEEFGV
ncbi:hypothetical protein NUW58_g8231 [Xylaria curta]|uniref:Uncharacterized protein n=1 Tax=Xylaria curta TaxID=42375 RepID=A0ACC1N9Y9_9PEZI|nr:hypothetical protein NUW58_g8231 [Xylaria curta]